MRTFAVPLLLALLAVVPLADRLVAATPPSRVRALTPSMARVLADGLRRSTIVQNLVAAINESDVVVYLTDSFSSQDGKATANMRFISAKPGVRFLVVCLDRWAVGPNARLELLGHELQHAVEVARAPEVRDLAGFRALYHRIGWEMEKGRFETVAAQQVTASIRNELDRARPRPDTGHEDERPS